VRYLRVYFDDDYVVVDGVDCELDVVVIGVDIDFVDDGDVDVVQLLVFVVGEGYGWCDGD